MQGPCYPEPVTCPACTEDLSSDDLPRCPHCGERLEEVWEGESVGFGGDSIAVATLCCVATFVVMLFVFI